MKKNIIVYLFIGILLMSISLGIFKEIMIFFDHNEHFYITAAVLIKENKILYKDFAFLQMPYLPLIYGYFFKIVNTSYYLLTGKVFSFLFFIISAFIIFLLSWRISKNSLFSISVVILYLLNSILIRISYESSNYILPVCSSFLAFYFYTSSINGTQIKPLRVFLSGFFIAVAIGTKLYYIVIIFPFIITTLYSLRLQSLNKRIFLVHSPLILGMITGFLPVFYYIVRDYEVFIFNNLDYHLITTFWLKKIVGYSYGMSLSSKVKLMRDVFFRRTNLIMILWIIITFLFAYYKSDFFRNIKQIHNFISPDLFLSFFLFIITVLATLILTPVYPQYFAMPVSFRFSSSYFCIPLMSESALLKSITISAILLTLVGNAPELFHIYVGRWAWQGIRIHNIAQKIKAEIGTKGNFQKLCTLSPLYAIEANIPIYHELSTDRSFTK